MSPRPRLVLASASPRRQELLRGIVREFAVVAPDVDETLDAVAPPAAAAALALRKARAVAAGVGDAIVLAADTLVILDGESLGKPADAADARRMLRRLRGRAHDVVTGVAVVDARTGRAVTTAVVTRVAMARFSDERLEAYVASGAPLDKAGGYAIQDAEAGLVEAFAGSYTNVVGLPVEETRRLLAGFGISEEPEP